LNLLLEALHNLPNPVRYALTQ
jgi:hypothetical protein